MTQPYKVILSKQSISDSLCASGLAIFGLRVTHPDKERFCVLAQADKDQLFQRWDCIS